MNDPGRKFASRYDPNAATIEANAEGLIGGVQAFHEALLASADNYACMEEANTVKATGAFGGSAS